MPRARFVSHKAWSLVSKLCQLMWTAIQKVVPPSLTPDTPPPISPLLLSCESPPFPLSFLPYSYFFLRNAWDDLCYAEEGVGWQRRQLQLAWSQEGSSQLTEVLVLTLLRLPTSLMTGEQRVQSSGLRRANLNPQDSGPLWEPKPQKYLCISKSEKWNTGDNDKVIWRNLLMMTCQVQHNRDACCSGSVSTQTATSELNVWKQQPCYYISWVRSGSAGRISKI